MAIERADATPRLKARSPAPHTREAVDVSADQVPQRVASERVARKQNHVDQHDQRADAHAELARSRGHGAVSQDAADRPAHRKQDIVRENEDEDHCRIHGIAMQVLKNERKLGLTLVPVARLTDGAGGRIEEEGPVVGLAIVVAGDAKGAGKNQDQECGRERPPSRLDQRRVERGEVRPPLIVPADPGGPGGVDAEAAEDQRRERGSDPPRVAAQRGAQAAFLQVANRCPHRVTSAIVPFTASADFFSALFSSAVSSTSTISSSPFLPSLHGTPQYIPDSPYSPSSQAAHGSNRFWSSAIDSTICTVADDRA